MPAAFYDSDPRPTGLKWFLSPFRRAIRRLQKPYYEKLQESIDQLHGAIGVIAAQHVQLSSQQSQLAAQHGQLSSQQGQLAIQVGELAGQQGHLHTHQTQLSAQHGQLSAQHGEVVALVGLLRQELQEHRKLVRGLAMDQTAVTRRLAAIEDQMLATLTPPG